MGVKQTGSCFSVLVVGVGAFIAAGLLSISLPCEARKIYRDKSGYFQFSPPPSWIQKGSSGDKQRGVRFASPDGKVILRVNVHPVGSSEKTWKNLLDNKKAAKKILEKDFPKAKVSLRETLLGGIKCIKIITEIPGSHVQANFVYVKKGLHFNLSYAARRQQDIDRHKKAVLASFRTIQPGK